MLRLPTGYGIIWRVVRDDANNQLHLYIDGVADNENPLSMTLSPLDIDTGGSADCTGAR